MDDRHGCGPEHEVISLCMGGELHVNGDGYLHLKRQRQMMEHVTYIAAVPKGLQRIVHALDLKNCKPATTHSAMGKPTKNSNQLRPKVVGTLPYCRINRLHMEKSDDWNMDRTQEILEIS